MSPFFTVVAGGGRPHLITITFKFLCKGRCSLSGIESEPRTSLEYWKHKKENAVMISPVLFNKNFESMPCRTGLVCICGASIKGLV